MAIETLKNKFFFGGLAIWSITPNGKILGQKIQKSVQGSTLFVSASIVQDSDNEKNTIVFKKLSKEIHLQFSAFGGHIFIFSTGIAVRMIAPLLKSKMIDPAVVVVDDNANYAISLVSGHMGGANHLAKQIADIINAIPVITTATDTNRLPSIDMIAKEQGLYIETPQNIKHVNMAFLKGAKVRLYDPFGCVKNNLPESFRIDAVNWNKKIDDQAIDDIGNVSEGESGTVFCSYETKDVSCETLVLRPRVLTVGIGCNRGTCCEDIKAFLISVLKQQGLSVNSIFRFATSDIKKDEIGLLALSQEMKIQIDFYDKNKLNSVKTIQTPSKMVEKHLGVKSVCEAAAILSAGNGQLIVPKKKNKDVTIAVAIKQ
ncbi:cobalt-precorrin 5A hydrolase [Desulfobacula toluolica]|uniref:CbiG: cobalamin biosynthesis protein n=1 Tax=Desulfobacula toluolica (strain DSM 7467 / Tol2) TaxID=651182 RepID=K0NQU0_DESTT|nr:cobalt-precorrin 5A hydrolase [Desulfobacula toluolica]CCK82498.1 CbiG: cobalamin biosynthesis protein [Desulfobacula toluolica Tol2]